MLVSLSQSLKVDDAWDSGSNQPRKSKESFDHVEEATEHQVIVVGFTMFQVVGLVVDKVPCDAIVEIQEKECTNVRSSSHEDDPRLSIEVSKISKPWASSKCFRLVNAVNRPLGSARSITTLEGWFKLCGHIQSLSRSVRESKFLDEGETDNRDDNRKIMNGSSDTSVAAEFRELEAMEEEDQPSSAKSKKDGKQSTGQIVVV